MTLEEIFKNNPKLLEEPEVRDLISYCQEMHKKMTVILNEYKTCHDEILTIVVHSEICLIKGMNAKEALNKIEESLCKF